MNDIQIIKRKYIIKVILVVCLAIALLGSLGYLTYNWYRVGDSTGKLGYQSYQIDSVVTMYRAEDRNYNGIPDRLSANNHEDGTYGYYEVDDKGDPVYDEEGELKRVYVAYDLVYYSEIYDFRYLDTTLVLSADTTANLFSPVEIENLYPSRVYTYKYALANYNYMENEIAFVFDSGTSIEGKSVTTGILSQFRVRLCQIDSEGKVVCGQWSTVAENTTLDPTGLNMIIPAYSGDSGSGRTDLWVQFQLLPDTDNTYRDREVILPDISIQFSTIETSDD